MDVAKLNDEDYPSDSKILWGCAGIIGIFGGMMVGLYIIFKIALHFL